MSVTTVPVRFVAGSRQLASVPRRLQTVAVSLEDLIRGHDPAWPKVASDADGLRVLSAPISTLDGIRDTYPGYLLAGIQRYPRHYIDMQGLTYEGYLGKFSSKTRSGFQRKQRRLAQAMDNQVAVREFRTAADVPAFMADAVPLSHRTYQGRLLHAGLPEDAAAIDAMTELAADGRLRAYILYGRGKALSYLYVPVHERVVIYAHLGYDPGAAQWSVGTILQLEAMKRLFAEGKYRYFDFTEGTGQHKEMFSTDSAEACSFLALKPSASNYVVALALDTFNGAVRTARRVAQRSGALAYVHRLLRS
jgi:hypothetical protein